MGYIEDYPKQYKDCAWLDFETLERFMKDALMAYGVPKEDADIVSDVLIESDKRGIDSHGIGRLKPIYLDRIDAGTQSPTTKIDILKDDKAVAVLDGNNGMGHVVSGDVDGYRKSQRIRNRNDSCPSFNPLRNRRLLCDDGDQRKYDRYHRNQRPAEYRADIRCGKYAGNQSFDIRDSDRRSFSVCSGLRHFGVPTR